MWSVGSPDDVFPYNSADSVCIASDIVQIFLCSANRISRILRNHNSRTAYRLRTSNCRIIADKSKRQNPHWRKGACEAATAYTSAIQTVTQGSASVHWKLYVLRSFLIRSVLIALSNTNRKKTLRKILIIRIDLSILLIRSRLQIWKDKYRKWINLHKLLILIKWSWIN